jgi:hypothetical protein
MLVSTLVEFGKYVQGELLEKELTLQDISTFIDDPECDPPKILSDIYLFYFLSFFFFFVFFFFSFILLFALPPLRLFGYIFEALIAAIYLDCNMDLDTVWEVIKRLILPFMEACIHPGSHVHPVSKFTQMCQQAGCRNFTFLYVLEFCTLTISSSPLPLLAILSLYGSAFD